jgi:YD repeat-containing protein
MPLGTTFRRLALAATVALLVLPAAALAGPIDVNHESTAVTEIGGGDGIINPGDAIAVTETLRDSEPTVPLTGVNGTLTATTPNLTVTQPTSAYPDFAFGDTAANTSPFNAQIDAAVQCGQNLGFSLALSADQGSATIPFTIGTGVAGAPVDRASVDVPHAIPDAGVLVSALPIATAGRVKDVTVHIGKITHPYDGDLRLTLISPDGTRVVLVNQRGGSGDDFVNTTFTSDQGPPIAGASAPFTGTFTAEGDMSRFVGLQQQGTWSLEIRDLSSSDVGTLDSWSTNTSPATCAAQPIAVFTATPNPALPGTTVQFDGSLSHDPVGTIVKYEWDLDGNGTFETDTGATATTSHLYATHGAYPVSLRVTDNNNKQNVYQRTVHVSQPPTADFTFTPLSPSTGQLVSLDAATSTDSDGTIVKYEWDLDGDGIFETDTGTTAQTSTSFTTAGSHVVRLLVTDDDGATAVKSQTIIVANSPPVAQIADPGVGATGRSLTLDASGSTDSDGTITNYAWDLDNNGTYETDGGTAPTLQHTFSTAASTTVGLQVTDSGSATATTTVTFTVTDPPIAAFSATPTSARPNQVVSFDASGSSDPDGVTLTYQWDLDGNGTFETDTGTTPTTSRSYATPATYAVQLQVTDADGVTTTTAHDVTVVNAMPIAQFTIGTTGTAVAGVPVTLDASTSSDPDGTIVRHEWDRDGNGSYETDTGAVPTTTRTYPNPGSVPVRLRVTDNDGAVSTVTIPVVVTPAGGGGTPGGGGTGGGSGGGTPPAGGGGLPGSPGDGTPGDNIFSAGLTGAPIQAMKLARRRGLSLACQATVAARCALAAQIDYRTARKLGLKPRKGKPVIVGRVAVDVAGGRPGSVVLKLTAKARRGLRRAKTVRVLVKGTASGSAGQSATLARTVLLRR